MAVAFIRRSWPRVNGHGQPFRSVWDGPQRQCRSELSPTGDSALLQTTAQAGRGRCCVGRGSHKPVLPVGAAWTGSWTRGAALRGVRADSRAKPFVRVGVSNEGKPLEVSDTERRRDEMKVRNFSLCLCIRDVSFALVASRSHSMTVALYLAVPCLVSSCLVLVLVVLSWAGLTVVCDGTTCAVGCRNVLSVLLESSV